MTKITLRRISAGLVLISYLLPWLVISALGISGNASGYEFLTEGHKMGSDLELEGFGIVMTIIWAVIALAVLTLVWPKILPSILLLASGAVLLLILLLAGRVDSADQNSMEYMVSQLTDVKPGLGVYVLLLGLIGIIASFFVKEKLQNPAIDTPFEAEQSELVTASEEVAASSEESIEQEEAERFCKNCGKLIKAEASFCMNCGSSVE